jgi:zinc protease
VEKQKVIQLAAISAEQEEPMNIARDALNAALFAGHPYHLTLLGTPRSVAGLDQAGLRDYYRRQLVTGNLVIALFGDITAKAAEALVSRYIDRIRQDVAPARLGAIPSPMLPTRLEKREPREQCIVLYGFPGVSLSDSRRDPLDLLEAATSGMSSRLFETVREKRGLAYYASTNQRFGLDSGIFTLFAGTRIDALPEVETLIREEIERVTTKGLEPEEVARARNMIIAEHEMRLQDNGTLAMMCALDELYGQGFAREFSTRKRIEAVTPEQIKQAAVSILTTNKLAISVVLPESTKPGAQPAN